MISQDESTDLKAYLRRLVEEADLELPRRYALRPVPTTHLSLYRRARGAIGRVLRRWGLRTTPPPEPWLPGLYQYAHGEAATPLVIWAVGCDRNRLRPACSRLHGLLKDAPQFSPVLITDVADFAFFSRLGWLVEFVPALSEPANAYAERKQRYLAWRYQGSPVLSISKRLSEGARLDDLLNG